MRYRGLAAAMLAMAVSSLSTRRRAEGTVELGSDLSRKTGLCIRS